MFIPSTAKRAKQTARKIAAALNYSHDKIVWYDTLYHCIPSVFEEVLHEIDDNVKTVFIVAHNPGITGFVNQLSAKFKTDNMPTCGVVASRFTAKQWNEFNGAEKRVFLFDYPKKEI